MRRILVLFLLCTSISSCSFFGEKNKVGDYIDKPDYSLKSVEYVPVLPNFGAGITPVSLYAGYDELLYAVDSAKAILSFDAAGNELGRFNLPGVSFVIQNRSLDLFALGRIDTIFNGLTYNLPVIYKLSQKTGFEGSSGLGLNLSGATIKGKYVYPWCINEPGKLFQKKDLEQVTFGSIGFMDDNSYYVTSSGPTETGSFITKRNSVLTFNNKGVFQGGFSEGDISPAGLSTLIQPPQRARMETKKDFIYTSITPDLAISVRYMEVILDKELGLSINFKPLPSPAANEANGSMYQTFKFKKPSSVLYAGTSQKLIFVADSEKDSIFVFQENGFEGVSPPPQYTNRKLINVSFGGNGNGPKQFKRPGSVAFFRSTLYVADAGNKRISRYKLTSDYE
jgi:hypothetical protein